MLIFIYFKNLIFRGWQLYYVLRFNHMRCDDLGFRLTLHCDLYPAL